MLPEESNKDLFGTVSPTNREGHVLLERLTGLRTSKLAPTHPVAEPPTRLGVGAGLEKFAHPTRSADEEHVRRGHLDPISLVLILIPIFPP